MVTWQMYTYFWVSLSCLLPYILVISLKKAYQVTDIQELRVGDNLTRKILLA